MTAARTGEDLAAMTADRDRLAEWDREIEAVMTDEDQLANNGQALENQTTPAPNRRIPLFARITGRGL